MRSWRHAPYASSEALLEGDVDFGRRETVLLADAKRDVEGASRDLRAHPDSGAPVRVRDQTHIDYKVTRR